MPGQSWQLNSTGAYFSNDLLSKNLREIAQPLTRFRQFCDVQSEFGAHEGQNLLFDKVMNVVTGGGELSEGVPIPKTNFTITQGICKAVPYGNSIPYTEEFEQFSEFDVSNPLQSRLIEDAAKTLDTAAEAAFAKTKIRYVPIDSVAPGADSQWSTDGTAPVGTRRDMTPADFAAVSDAMKSGNYAGKSSAPVPFYDNSENYVCIGSVSALRQLRNPQAAGALSWREDVHYGDPARNFAGEAGRWEAIRFVEENHILGRLKNVDGTDSAFGGEAYMFGAQPVMEIQVVPMEVRKNIPGDYGRDRGLGWFSICGFQIIWEYNETTEKDNRIVRIG